MNLATIDIDPAEAKAKLAEYEQVLGHERTAEDHALAQAYRAVKRGLPVIKLSEVMHAGGYFENGLPRIAIIRADAEQAFVRVERNWRVGHRSYVFGTQAWPENRGALVGSSTVRVTTPGPTVTQNALTGGQTTVPLIPPKHRPRRPRLRACHILWEVEGWDRTMPHDPALLKHLRGDLWAVLSTWDLTDLERAVLSQRRS